jgi:DNA-binding XRE family transcriptional regulator
MQFETVRYLPRERALAVSFVNGDRFEVPVEALLKRDGGNATWTRLRIAETRDVLEVPVGENTTEIPWDRVRCIADPAFRRHLANQAAKSARRVGSRLRYLRQQSGLTQEAVARSAGLSRVTISRLENGALQPIYETLVRVLAAMGRSVQDMAPEPDALASTRRAGE